MPANQTTFSSGVVTLTSGLPISGVTGILLYCYTDGNGGGNSTGIDDCTIYQFQGMGPIPIYQDIGLTVQKGGDQRIGVLPLSGSHNLRVHKGGTTYGIPLLSTGNPGAGNVRIAKGGTVYSLPNAAYSPDTNLSTLAGSSYSWSGGFGSVSGSGFNYGWDYSGGGSNGSGTLTSLFSQPYTLDSIVYNLYLHAYGYGDDWQTWYVQFNIYYTTTPVGFSPSWIQLYEYNQGAH